MPIRLNLGCFHQIHKGWVNTDITPNIHISCIPFAAALMHKAGLMLDEHHELHKQGVFRQVKYLNVTRRFPYKDNSVECVFCSHMLEHLYPNQAEFLFSEVFRVLKPSGIFRVVVPDLDKAIKQYNRSDPTRFLESMYEYGGGTGKNSHRWMYTEISLKQFFEKCGYVDVQICTFQSGRLPDVEKVDCRPDCSIFVEGTCT